MVLVVRACRRFCRSPAPSEGAGGNLNSLPLSRERSREKLPSSSRRTGAKGAEHYPRSSMQLHGTYIQTQKL